MESKCDFGKLLGDSCHKNTYTGTNYKIIKNLIDLNEDVQEQLLWRAGLHDRIGCREDKVICLP